jgi:hypothetical protein
MMRPRHNIHSAVWLIGLAVLFFTGLWWPGILVLVGISMVLEWVFSNSAPPTFQPEIRPVPQSPAAPVAPAPVPAAPASPIAFTKAEPFHPLGALPSACPRCGGPVRAQEVKWTGPRSAVCAYCGSALPLKKA